MPKPHNPEKMLRVSFTLEESEKEKWVEKAKEIGRPLAVLIKEAMSEHLYNSNTKNKPSDEDIRMKKLELKIEENNQLLYNRIENLLDENKKLEKRYETKFTLDSIKLKNKTIILLENSQMNRLELEEVLEPDGMNADEFRKQYRRLLSIWRRQGYIKFLSKTEMWCIK